jgi:soluble lytic murein transglycosylase-like protein
MNDKELAAMDSIKELIIAIAHSYNLPPNLVAGIVSRESGAGLLLGKGGNPSGTGDRGHGRGLMQADDRFWKGFLNLDASGGEEDAWKYPAFNIAFGCWLLRKNIRLAQGYWPNKPVDFWVHAAVAGYNCGMGNVHAAVDSGHGVDSRTFGKDYSTDVMDRRAVWYARHGYPVS